MKNNFLSLLKELPGLRSDIKLAPYTTFKIGGLADFFFEAKTEEEIIKAVNLSQERKIPFFILGGGSNLLVGDKGFRGLVIKISNIKYQISNTKMMVEAGVPLSRVIGEAAKNSLTGLEFAVGILGTIGGAIVGNAGAWQQAIGERVLRIKVLTPKREIAWIDQVDCQFGYRESRFKKSGEIVLGAQLKLESGDEQAIRKTMKTYLEKRKNQPREPSAGSVFVNPKPASAGRLIGQCGLKGYRLGDAQISPQHANFIVNLGGAKSGDVLKLISLAKKEVKKKFGLNLVEEIKTIGEF